MSRLVLFLSSVTLLCACGGVTVDENIQRFAPSYCAKLKSCYDKAYKAAYPAGDEACVDTFRRGLTQEQLESATACTDEQIDTCVSAIAAMQCGSSLNDSPVPAACTCR